MAAKGPESRATPEIGERLEGSFTFWVRTVRSLVILFAAPDALIEPRICIPSISSMTGGNNLTQLALLMKKNWWVASRTKATLICAIVLPLLMVLSCP